MLASFRTLVQFTAILTFLVTLTQAAPHYRARAGDGTDDPFYQYTKADVKNKKPGTIVRSRKIAMPALKNTAATWQILYVTTAVNGSLIAEVTSVATPSKPASGAVKFLSIQNPEDSAAYKCSPSFQLSGANSDSIGPADDMNMGLSKGYIVSSPDYESPDSGFVVGPLAGMGVLDGVRAVLNHPKIITNKKKTLVALTGYSGGALASGWAAQLQPTYAPELKILGAAVGGMTVNIRAILLAINKTVFAGIAVSGVAGVANVYKDVRDYLYPHLNADGKAAFKTVSQQCLAGDITSFANKDVFSYLDISQATVLADSRIKSVFKKISLGGPQVGFPLFSYYASNDEIIVPKELTSYIKDQCDQGAQIESRIWNGPNGHVSVMSKGLPYAFDWLEDRFAGKAAAKGCPVTTVPF